ncbi:NPC intracellular cholesterol transporter 2 [Lucilia cuprina]|uniref:NPC intracellular cholesterol transporter 2 n=1 Tax=Lucilia cuprina TaxID=7375 RepID=UPI001F05138D|nr:NPC intracellular cholesterol transporter 2 [Lucilia cuprina]
MYIFLLLLGCLIIFVQATEVKQCGDNKPFPLDVRVKGCDIPPCDIVKGTSVEFEIDLVAHKFITSATTLVKAKTLGITVPYELPEDVRDVCSNLMYEAYCPLYDTEDVTYLFLFPIASTYPEISVNVEIYIVDQDEDLVTCFKCDIKVKKGSSVNSKAIYELNWLNSTFIN